MNKHLSALWMVSAFLSGCASSEDDGSDQVATSESAITAGSVTLGGTSNTCGGGAPQLIFSGIDAAGHETYNFYTKLSATSGSSCSVRGQILFPSNFCIRIKGSTISGKAFSTPSAFGSVRVRSQWLQVVSGFLDNVVQVPVSSAAFSIFQNVFQPGPLSPRGVGFPPGLTVVVTPTVTASGGTASQPPSITADFSSGGTTTTLEAVPNC